MKKLIFVLGMSIVTNAVQAQNGPGRDHNISAIGASLGSGGTASSFQPAFTPVTQTASAIAEAITPDIQALAGNLGYDPTRIYNYVHDQIRYVHYFGSKKGAELTLLEQSGNDFDQCALLASLLQASGYATAYQFAVQKMSYDDPIAHKDLHHWLGLSFFNTNWVYTSNYFAHLAGTRGNPVWFTFPSDTNTIGLQRVWVTVTIGGTNYYLDPAFKVSEPVTNINLSSAMGLSTPTLWTAAGGTDTGYSVTGLTESALRTSLQTCNGALLSYISNNAPEATIAQVIGGQQIVSSVGTPLSTALPFSSYTPTGYPLLNWTNQPTNFMGTFSISLGGTNQTWYTPELQGQRISLTFNSNALAQLWLDDSLILQTTNTGTSNTVNVVLTATHPYGGNGHGGWNTSSNIPVDGGVLAGFDKSSTNAYQRTNASYAIIYAFEANQRWLQGRQQQLDAYRAQGLSDSSRQITTETLNVMGLGWMVQTELAEELLCQEWGQLVENQHRFGRMGQESGRGYYVDVYLQESGTLPSTGAYTQDFQSNYEVFDVSSYIMSAMEHGIIEQLQESNLVAASTVKMLEIANTNSQIVYMASSNDWTTSPNIRGSLIHYDSTTLSTMDGLIASGYILLLPKDGSNTIAGPGTWAGNGFVELGSTGTSRSMGMIINGAYNGGYSENSSDIIPPSVFMGNTFANQFGYFNPQPATLPLSGQTGADPVNLVDGSFEIASSDLTLGQTEPRGLNLTRFYSSGRRHSNLAGMAPGWLHSYYCNILRTSAPQIGLGGGTVQQMTPMIVATYAALNLYTNTGSLDPKNWTVTALIAKWGIDQLINNAVSVNLGNSTIQFLKQPNGTFTPQANCTLSLVPTNNTYWLQERHGRTFKFGTNNLLTNIVDQYGQSMKLKYNSNNLVTNVTDWTNRTLTFTYTAGALSSVADSTGRSVSYGYTGGLLTSYTDPEGKTASYTYDSSNELNSTIDDLGRLVVTNTYDGFGHITTQLTQGDTNKTWQIAASGSDTLEVDPAGDLSAFTYDNQSRLVASQDGLGNVTQMAYDGQDHVIQTISPLNETNLFFYDGSNNLIYTVDPLGFTNTLVYDSQNNLVETIDALGNASHFGYDTHFSLIGQTNGAGDWAVFTYNSNGTLATRKDSAGTTTYGYDNHGALSSISYPSPLGSESFVNNALGDPTSHTDPREFVTTFAYNNRRQLTNTVAPTNITTTIAYDSIGNVSTMTDPRGFVTSNSWSVTRHLLTTTFPLTPLGSPFVTNTYDARDWLAQTQDPLGDVSFYTNDAAHHLIAGTDPLQRSTQFTYDNDGRQHTATDAASDLTTQTWNSRGNLVLVVDAATNSVGRTYDAAGNVIYLTNRNNNVWQFQYDGANHLTNTISPLSHATSQTYNNRGLLASVTDALSRNTTYGYDGRGRMTNRADSVGTTVYKYDLDCNLTNASENGKSLVKKYDAYNRITSYTDVNGYQVQYKHDANGNLTNLIYPGGLTIKYYYDGNNRLTNVTDWGSRQTGYAYDLAGHLTSVTRPNNTVRAMTYDADGELINIVDQTTGNFPICFYTLNYNLAGRVQWEFKGPLIHPSTPPSRTMTFDNDNRLATFNGTSVTIDADGNMTYGPGTNNTFGTYAYDPRNRLTSDGGISYGYDLGNNRVSLTNGASVSVYVIDPQSSQVLMRMTGGVTNYYVYGRGLLYEVDVTATTTNVLYYHSDMRGSTVALTDGSGNLTDQFEYSPYGTTTYHSGTNTTPFLYNGQFGVQTDPNGLLFMRARYYNPYLCRFINADPSGFAGGLNFYAFCNDNPISNEDPFGLQVPGPVEIAIGFGPGFGQSIGAYNSQVQAVSQQALAIEGLVGGGALLGAGGATVVGAGAVGLVSLGVPQSVVTGGLLVTGGVGAVATGYSVYNNPSINNIAFTAGSLGGGLLVGGVSANYVASALSPSGYQPSGPASLSSDVSMAWKDASGNINPFAFLSDWLSPGAQVGPMSTGPSTIGAAATVGGAGAGVAAGSVDWLGNPVSTSSTGKPH